MLHNIQGDNMKTGLVDIKGHEIELGDKIRFLYADPLGRLDQDTLELADRKSVV